MQKIYLVVLLLLLASCDYESNSGQTTALENIPIQDNPAIQDPIISPASAYAGQAVMVQDPDGRIQTGDILVFYPDGGSPETNGEVAVNIIVADAYTITGEVPATLTVGADYWLSVRADVSSPSRFAELAFTPLAPPNVSFLNQVFPLLETYCSSCHSAAKPAANLDLSTANASYLGMVNVLSEQCTTVFMVAPGDSSASYLMDKLYGTNMCAGGIMPKGDSMTAEEIDTIRLWIDQGANNN